jgi:hypothetical protein
MALAGSKGEEFGVQPITFRIRTRRGRYPPVT